MVALKRYCFTQQVRRDRLDEYIAAHAAVWPEMLEALRDSGWKNYSIFLSTDGLLVGYVESEDLDAAQAAMEKTAVNARWQAEMGGFFEDLPGGSPDQSFVRLTEVFNLDDQLAAAAAVSRDDE